MYFRKNPGGVLMRRIGFLILVLFTAGLLTCTGCSNRQPQRKPAETPVRVGFALADMNRDGNKAIKKTVDERKKAEQVQVTWLDAKNDPAEQDKQLDELMKKKVQAVVLQPVDPARAPAQVEKLARAGIKVVVQENLPLNTPVDAFIASDHTMIGRLQARFVTEALRRAGEIKNGLVAPPPGGGRQGGGQGQQGGGQGGGQGQQDGGQGGGQQDGREGGQGQQGGQQGGRQGQAPGAVDYNIAAQLADQRPLNVVILRGDPRDQMDAAITAACREALQGRDDVTITGIYEHPGLDPAMVPATLGQLVARDERVDVVLANDSSLAVAAVDYLKNAGLDKNVLTVGVGANQQASMALVRGEHDAEVDVQPEMLGRFALEAARDLAKNGSWQYNTRADNGDYTVPARIVPVRLVTAKNAYLLEERWKDLQQQQQQGGGGGGGGQGGQQEQQGQQGGQQEQQARGDQGGGQQGGQQGKTMLRITTQDGKTMEVQIDGEVKKIESTGGGQGGGGGQQQQ